MDTRVDRFRFICQRPKTDLVVEAGDGPATPTAGAANWEVLDVAEGKSLTDRVSSPPFQQEVPLMFDGYAPPELGVYSRGTSVQRDLDALMNLRGAVFKVEGPIHKPHLRYVFGGEPDYGEVIRDDDGTLLRQRVTLHLMEYVPPDVLRRRKDRSRQGVATFATSGSSYITKKGDTLQEIAANLYGDWKRWKEIGRKNGIRDPLRKLPAGRQLKL